MNNIIKIAIACHKESILPNNDLFLPIQVGAELSEIDLHIQKDNEGDNISILNPFYCELTALYYLWKNYPNLEYYGLCHYRRYLTFCNRKLSDFIFQLSAFYFSKIFHVFSLKSRYTLMPYICKSEETLSSELSRFEKILYNDLENNRVDFYCAKKVRTSTRTLYEHFSIICGYQRVEELKFIIKEYYPDYLSFYEEVMEDNSFHPANLMISSKEIFNEYCQFIFFILEKHFVLNGGSSENIDTIQQLYSRLSGYLSEILTEIFIRKMISERKKYRALNIIYVVSKKEITPKNKLFSLLMKMGIFNVNFIR